MQQLQPHPWCTLEACCKKLAWQLELLSFHKELGHGRIRNAYQKTKLKAAVDNLAK